MMVKIETNVNNESNAVESEDFQQIYGEQFALKKIHKRYKFLTGVCLSILVILLIFVLALIDMSVALQQAIVVIIGLFTISAMDTFKRVIEDDEPLIKNYNPVFDESRKYYEYNTIYNGHVFYNQEQNLSEIAAKIKQMYANISETYTDWNSSDPPILEAKLIEEIKENATNQNQELADKDIEIVAKVSEAIEKDAILKSRVISALKTGGIQALQAALSEKINHHLASLIISTIEGWKDINQADS